MCGIIGIFNNPKAEEQVKLALPLLKNRGRDGSGIAKINPASFLGHTLHALVNHVPQPITRVGTLAANCEIYNWRELADKYNFKVENDADLLLQFLDKRDVFGSEPAVYLSELDGVYSFAYIKGDKVILARDLLGVKPLWYSYVDGSLAIASEKKVLENLGYNLVKELNPRAILIYHLKLQTLNFIFRDFLTYLPEHQLGYGDLKQTTKKLLREAVKKRIPNQKFGLLFSGGVDSTFLAKCLQDLGQDFICYTAVLDTEGQPPQDLIWAQKAAAKLNLKLRIKKIKLEDLPGYLKEVITLIEDSNVVKVGVGLTFYLACELAKEDGCKVIFSGLGSEEIFAGYERHKNSPNINPECLSGLLKIYERDLYRDDVITMENNLELRLPFLDLKLVNFALKIPGEFKIKSSETKLILRDIALADGIDPKIAFRKKTAAQYGSKIDNALSKLAKLNGFVSKSAYLQTFYHPSNVKLGVLFSSGKDSTSAAYIMQQQNYELTCLITLKSKNNYSYMFQSAGTELVELQAQSMGIPILIQETKGVKEEELADLEEALNKAKEKYQIEGIVNGAIFSTYQRDRIEKICDRLQLKIFSPLWHKPQEQQMYYLVHQGFTVVITAVAADGLDESWLGREIDEKMIEELKRKNLNLAGEGGEFESLVLDAPLFNKKLEIIRFRKIMDGPHSGKLIIDEAVLKDK